MAKIIVLKTVVSLLMVWQTSFNFVVALANELPISAKRHASGILDSQMVLAEIHQLIGKDYCFVVSKLGLPLSKIQESKLSETCLYRLISPRSIVVFPNSSDRSKFIKAYIRFENHRVTEIRIEFEDQDSVRLQIAKTTALRKAIFNESPSIYYLPIYEVKAIPFRISHTSSRSPLIVGKSDNERWEKVRSNLLKLDSFDEHQIESVLGPANYIGVNQIGDIDEFSMEYFFSLASPSKANPTYQELLIHFLQKKVVDVTLRRKLVTGTCLQ